MKSIRISKMNVTQTAPTKINAFVLTPRIVSHTEHQVKLSQFIHLIKTCGAEINQINTVPEKYQWGEFDFVFIDLYHQQFPYDMPVNIIQLCQANKVIFFNVADKVIDEIKLLLSGLIGVFYQEDRADIILKGIESINNNDFWFKRETMNKALSVFLKVKKTGYKAPQNSKYTPAKSSFDHVFPSLTKREKTIVGLVSSGAQNKEIADQLHISPNTVKTHIYSIFRKTSSRNRIELLAWSQQLSPQLLN